MKVTMYSRAACGLCDEAREVILEARAEVPFEYEEVFIDGRNELERAYGLRVPVVLIGGQERFELHLDPASLRQALSASGA